VIRRMEGGRRELIIGILQILRSASKIQISQYGLSFTRQKKLKIAREWVHGLQRLCGGGKRRKGILVAETAKLRVFI